ncbi:MAG: hypothetical protein BWK80_36950 [Desulfobacteraceae bacterium IS3]|nr:MAG: hypothetical protein BWK80_36950 [Desulfobacteraceae bacterium IS3]
MYNIVYSEDIIEDLTSKPVILIVGVKGMDIKQLQLGSSGEFWKFITKRQDQKTISREESEKRISAL